MLVDKLVILYQQKLFLNSHNNLKCPTFTELFLEYFNCHPKPHPTFILDKKLYQMNF